MKNAMTIVPSEQPYLDQARATAREVLAQSNMFKAMSLTEQQELYSTLVKEETDKAKKRAGVVSQSMATDSGKEMGYKGYDPSFGQDTKSFNELVDSVDFPQFVGDLLKAVFNANLRVMKEQTDSYIKLMKEATKSSADFVKGVKDDESFLKLAESKQGQYSVTSERQADGSNKIVLADPSGEKVDPEDAAVKKDILEAKLMMAKEHRAALREVLLMGVTRLVVEKGEIEASVDFSVTANRKSDAHHDDQNINVTSANADYGGGISTTNTNIQVNTSNKSATDTLSANLHGKVNIKFKTDYFKLDNFANMYADGGVAALKPPAAAGAPGAPTK